MAATCAGKPAQVAPVWPVPYNPAGEGDEAMSRFTVKTVPQQGETLYVLGDAEGLREARVWPAFGNNCLAARLPVPGGRRIDVILEPERLAQVREQPSWWGVPLLFPWPGRIPGGRYVFGGAPHQLPDLDAHGNAIHGFVKDRPWRVEAASADDTAATLRCSFSSADHPETLRGYPFPYRLEATYRLGEPRPETPHEHWGLGAGPQRESPPTVGVLPDALSLRVVVSSQGDGPMPFGFGAHPYFRIPVAPDGERARCAVRVPAARRWNLRRLGTLAADERLTWDDVTEPVADECDLRRPQPLGDRTYDGGFTDLEAGSSAGPAGPGPGWIECGVADPAAGLELLMQATGSFGTVVVYTPPGRPGICFEPWTCPPNAFNLAARGVERSGLIVLQPGERWTGEMRLACRQL